MEDEKYQNLKFGSNTHVHCQFIVYTHLQNALWSHVLKFSLFTLRTAANNNNSRNTRVTAILSPTLKLGNYLTLSSHKLCLTSCLMSMVNSYGHVWTVSNPNNTISGKLHLST